MTTAGEIVRGRDRVGAGARSLALDTDVVIVGSGASGAVVAAELAEAGQRVIVLEEGPHVPAEQYAKMRPSETMRHLWRDGAMTAAIPLGNTPMVNVHIGRCVGGSSVLTGGVCFRVPDAVLAKWSDERMLTEYTPDALDPYFTEVERAIEVSEVPVELRSRSTELFARGAERIGLEIKSMSRNTRGCNGCGRCNFGCPHGAKLGVDVTYLPRAIRAGASIYSDCLVDRILVRGDRAVGVRGRVLAGPGGGAACKLEVRARRVVIAAGAFHTPLLLMRSGVGRASGQVGRNMTLHPGFRVFGRFDEPVRGWRGALQSAYSDTLERERITLTSLFVPPGVLAATMPGVGAEHVRRAASVPHLAMFGGIVHDEGGGTVHRTFGREPLVTYRMGREDRAAVPKLLRTMAQAFLEAGAREVYLPIFGAPPVDADALRRLDLARIPGRKLECGSQHPLGTCRMGISPDRSVVDQEGRVWDVRDLYVVDGSTVPTSLGVNPQLTIMALATRFARLMLTRPFGDT